MRVLRLCTALLLTLPMLAKPATATAQPAEKRPPITGIAFVSFAVSDAAAADRFYGSELGLQRVLQSAGKSVAPFHVYAVNPQQWISFAEASPSPAPGNSRLRAVGFTTTDLPELTRYLAAKGYASAMPLPPGQLAVRDPEGNVVIFVQRGQMEGVAHSTLSTRAISHRIIHAGFVVHDEAKENSFWRGVLGFKPYWRGGRNDSSTDYVSQQVPDGSDWVEYMLNVPANASAQSLGGSNHVSLGVEKMSTVLAQLKLNGCTTEECTAAKLGRDGKVQLNLFDPDHSRVEVMEFRPSGPTCCSTYTAPHPSETR